MERKVIVIVGPTCTGKTSLGIKIAARLKSEILSADSRQVYKYLTIGTAKPEHEDLKKAHHYFIDDLEPNQDYNVSMFEQQAIDIIKMLHTKNKIPVVVGGSGLYIKALIDGIFDIGSDENFRRNLLDERRKYGNEYIYQKLKSVDPISADKMLPQNWKRVMRALEVYHLTGKPIWKLHNEHNREIDFKFIQFGLKWDRDKLYENIDQRVDKMLSSGLIDEVKSILEHDYDSNLNSLNTVGYKEIISYLNDEITLERAAELIKRNTRRYAKRQLTWFNADERINWIEMNNFSDIEKAAEIIFDKIN